MSSLIAASLARRRRVRGLSQGDLARAAGVTRQAIGSIESGRAQPGVGVALALARTLDATVEELFGSNEAPTSIDAELAPGHSTLKRTAIAMIHGRVLARALDVRETPLAQPAGALIAAASHGRARVEPISAPQIVESTVFLSGCEPALGLLAGHASANGGHVVWFSMSNREALSDLVNHRAHVAAFHGSDADLRRSLQRLDGVELVHLATIEEGWIVAGGNPLGLRGARDVARANVRLANRPAGSAARALLDAELRRADISARSVTGYAQALAGHADVARAIAFGYADVAVGVGGVAEAFGLSFIPLRAERCVLATRRSDLKHSGVSAMLGVLRSNGFRRDLSAFGPYDVARCGQTA